MQPLALALGLNFFITTPYKSDVHARRNSTVGRSEMTSNFTVTFSAYDRANHRPLFFKADGRRFSSERTVKIGCDVKYDVTVTVKPSVFPLQ